MPLSRKPLSIRFFKIIVLGAILLLACGQAAAQKSAAQPVNVAAGFLNTEKNKLLILNRGLTLPRFTQAWCDQSAGLEKIRFIGTQREAVHATPSEDSRRFNDHAGDVYAFASERSRLTYLGHADNNDNATHCMAMNESFLAGKVLNPIDKLKGAALPEQNLQHIASTKNRKIKQSWAIGRLADGSILGAVWFAAQGKNELASYVLITPNHTLFDDMPAVRKSKDEDLWGLEDGGEFNPNMGDLYFSYVTPKGVALAYKQWGAEGTHIVLNEFSAKGLKKIYGEYFYVLH